MISKINKLLSVIIIVGIALYVVLINKEEITFRLTPNNPLTANTGLVILIAFGIGILVTTLFALFFGMRFYFRERGLLSKERQRKAFLDSMLRARGYEASQEWEKCKEAWEYIAKRDPTSIVARVELSKTLQGLGDNEEALRVLDGARSANPNNVEVLFRAAEMYQVLGNKTAALDNFAIIIQNHPNKLAVRLARNLSEELEKYDRALEYHEMLADMDDEAANDKTTPANLKLKQLVLQHGDHSGKGDSAKLVENIKFLLRKYPDHAPSLEALAQELNKSGKTTEAAELLLKAAKASGEASYWDEAAKLWLKNSAPDKALAATKTAANEAKGAAKISANINLAKLFIALSMLEDALTTLNNIPILAKNEGVIISQDQNISVLSLKGLALNRSGQTQEASDILRLLSTIDGKFLIPTKETSENKLNYVNNEHTQSGVSPFLSTP